MEKMSLYLIPKEKIEEFKSLLRQFGIKYRENLKYEKIEIKGKIKYIDFPNCFSLYHNEYKGFRIYINEYNELYINFFNELLGEYKSLGPLKKDYILIHYDKDKLIIEFP